MESSRPMGAQVDLLLHGQSWHKPKLNLTSVKGHLNKLLFISPKRAVSLGPSGFTPRPAKSRLFK